MVHVKKEVCGSDGGKNLIVLDITRWLQITPESLQTKLAGMNCEKTISDIYSELGRGDQIHSSWLSVIGNSNKG